jgi:2'-5' RNA ligase
MIRLFVSLNIPLEIRESIMLFRKEAFSGEESNKWEPKEKLHITLKFIGEIQENLLKKISEELTFIENYPIFECSLNNFGFFVLRGIPKILWIGVNAGEKIYSLVDEINVRLKKFSVQPEKKAFKSHITLLRLKGNPGENFINSFQKFSVPAINFRADEISLMQSQLLPLGSRYKEIKKYNLK